MCVGGFYIEQRIKKCNGECPEIEGFSAVLQGFSVLSVYRVFFHCVWGEVSCPSVDWLRLSVLCVR